MVSKEIEQALDAYDRATCEWNVAKLKDGSTTNEVGLARALAAAENFQATRAALIALLARDDARIARLEDVAKAVKGCMVFAPQDGDSGAVEIYDDYCRQLNEALAALDADAPGGG